MIITRIERTRSRQARYRVRFDEGEPIVISEDLFIRLGLARGDTVSPAQMKDIRDASERDTAKQGAYRYLSYRPRSEHEVMVYLRRKGFSPDRCASTIEECRDLGLLNDEEFAAMVVRDMIGRGRSGPAAVRKKLADKRIARAIVDKLIDEHFTDDVVLTGAVEILKKRVERTRRSLQRLDPAKRRARLYQYLCQRGFSGRTAARALQSIEV